MRWSWKLGRISGITVQVHWTFLILIAWVVAVHASRGATVGATLGGIALVLTVFACVVLHELGHALTARRYGITTRDITLLPIGGVARLERMPEDPRQELAVAAAGPAVNVVIAGALFALLAGTGVTRGLDAAVLVGGNLLAQLMWVNVVLVAFNLIPAFPMDGGRMLRAALATRIAYARATRIAATIGQGLAVLFGFLGLFNGNPFLIFIAVFVYLGAQAEAQQAETRSALAGVSVRSAMMTRFRALAPTEPLQVAVDELLAGWQQDFPVVEDGQVMGMLVRTDLVRALKAHGPQCAIGEVMRGDVCTAHPDEPVHAVVTRMRGMGASSVPVIDGDRLQGLLTLENVGEFLMVSAAMRGGPVLAPSDPVSVRAVSDRDA
jgi:Zn-dependent protease/CBS domain-containing protein